MMTAAERYNHAIQRAGNLWRALPVEQRTAAASARLRRTEMISTLVQQAAEWQEACARLADEYSQELGETEAAEAAREIGRRIRALDNRVATARR